jgi:hypothetical protein
MILVACCGVNSEISTSAGVRRKTKQTRGKDMVNHIYSIIRTAVVVLLLAASMPLEAAVQAELDRNRITEGETVTLTILTDDPRQNLDTDFSALDQNFQILDRRSETQLSIVNGRQTAVVRLLLTLEPKAEGEFVIPPLKFGSDSTQAISVQVDPVPELEPGSQPPVFIEVEITPVDGPYFVHAQFGLIVRVFYQQNLTEAAISQPEPSPAALRLLQETPYQAERGGERYRVLERNYAVFPERSGELTIPPMQLTGRLVERRTSNVWQPAVRGRRVQVESEVLQLLIEPKPVEFSGAQWQPARDYRLTQQVSSGDALRVGEPVTRTVIIDAIGLEENMIIEPAWPELPGARIYPDQPQGITRDDGQWVLGHKEFRYAVVPEQEGELVLPELKVEWWDTKNNQARSAVLDAHTVSVQPSALVPPPVPTAVATDTATEGMDSSSWSGTRGEPAYWRWLALLFAMLWLLTLFAAWKMTGRKRGRKADSGSGIPIAGNETGMLASLEQACKSGDIRRTRRALQLWLRDFGPLEGNGSLLEFAAAMGDPVIGDAIRTLDSNGFRPGSGPEPETAWNGGAFWKQFEIWRKNWVVSGKNNRPALTDLYATENRV